MSHKFQALSALLLCLAIAGCDKAEDGKNGSIGVLSLFDPVAANPSLCGGAAIPFPNNALFSGTTDATLNIPNPANAPFVTAANLTDGFSTTASIFTDVLGSVDYATAADAILILEVGSPPRFLVPGTDFTVASSPAMAAVSGSGAGTGTCLAQFVPLTFQPISQQRSRILIEPLKPLKPSTTYIVAVTKALKSKDGIAATANEFFGLVNSDTKICRLSGAEGTTEPLCSDENAMAEAAARLGAPALLALDTGGLNPTTPPTANEKLATLETLRRSLVRPTVTAFKGLAAAPTTEGGPIAIADQDLVIAWSFTTQSIGLTLSRLDTSVNSAGFQVANTTVSTGDLGLGLADTADIYAGVLALPYYLANSGGNANSFAPLATPWASAATLNAVNPPALGGAVPCGALAKSASTTICYPDPSALSTETIPVMVTVPNNNVCAFNPTICSEGVVQKPANGWPVVVFQHGITRNRTDVLALAPTLAIYGHVTVAIDQPLHGLTSNASPFYRNQLFTSTPAAGLITGERTFDLDVSAAAAGNACGSGADGTIDPSGTCYINLGSLIVSRDNLRQSAADILHLVRSLGALDLDNNPMALTATDLDETRVRFVGQSLGAIVGTVAMAIDAGADATADEADELVGAAVLNVPGGGLGKMLDASASFGPRIAAGLGAGFVFEGTDTYETFIRFAQHLTDPGDPINYAAAANANHPVLLTEVIGDAVVPNNASSTCPDVYALPPLSAVATANDPPGTPPPASAPVLAAQAAASGVAGATIMAQCPPLVIPAAPPQVAITYQDRTLITGYLSGTDPLIRIMGITNIFDMGSAPFASQTSTGGDSVVVFGPTTAEHGTLLSPHSSSIDTDDGDTDPSNDADAAFAAATCAQQKQTATFVATNGAVLPVGGSCP